MSGYFNRLVTVWTRPFILLFGILLGASILLKYHYGQPLLAHLLIGIAGAMIGLSLYVARENVFKYGLEVKDSEEFEP